MRFLLPILLVFFVSVSCAGAQESNTTEAKSVDNHVQATKRHDDNPRPYDGERDAMSDVDAALTAARENGKKALVIMGANWCHDSRGLAGRFERPEFQTLIGNAYELVYVSAGTKPGQNDQNREISQRFGVEKIKGTPTIFIIGADGQVLNAESTGYWRRADSIPVDMSFAYFDYYAKK